MKKIFKTLAAIFIFLTVILILATIYVSKNLDRFKDVIITRIESSTGRNLVVAEAEMALSLTPEVKLKDVSLANVSWGSRPQMVKAEEVVVTIDLLALLQGDIEFDEIQLIGPDVYLETNAQGQDNWFSTAETTNEAVPDGQESSSGVPVVGLKELNIEKGTLFYLDGRSKRDYSINIDHLTLQYLHADNSQVLDLKAKYLEQPFTVSGKLGRLKSYLSNRPFPIELKVESEGIQAAITGEISRPMDLQGLSFDLNLKLETLSSLSWIAGNDLPSYGPLKINGKLTDDKGAYRLSDFSATLGKSDLSGSVEFRANKNKPKIVASLTASELRPSDFSSEVPADKTEATDSKAQEEGRQGEDSHVFSEKPLPLDWLKNIDTEISLKAQKVSFDSLPLQNLAMKLAIENGLLTAEPVSAEFAGGSIDASLIINSSSAEPEFKADMNASQIVLGEIINSMAEESMDGGKSDITFSLTAQGRSWRDLASSLNGRVVSTIGNARIYYDLGISGGILPVEIFNKLNPLAAKQKTGELECAVIHFDIKDGIATSDKGLAYETKSLKALGEGTIDLKNEKIDILLSSKSTVANLLQIKGPLGKPDVGLNPAGVLKKGTSWGTAILTGGLSLAAEAIFKQVTSKGSPCEIARRGI